MLRLPPLLACIMLASIVTLRAAPAAADNLAEGRRLFAEALEDEQEKRFDIALDKFRRVQAVRDTAPIRYRIGACLEGLGRPRAAVDAYEGAATLAQQAKPADVAVMDGAKERIALLKRRIARENLASDRPDAEARGHDPSPPHWIGYGALATGGVLVAASAVTLLLRHSDIADITRMCPNDACPRSREAEVSSLADRARTEGTVGVVLGGAGLLAAGVGAFVLLRGPGREHASSGVAPLIGKGTLGAVFEGRF